MERKYFIILKILFSMVCGEILVSLYFRTSIFAGNDLGIDSLSNAALPEACVYSSAPGK